MSHSSELEILTRDDASQFLDELESGRLRAAYPTSEGEWIVDSRVKQAILAVFRLATNQDRSDGVFHFTDRDLLMPAARSRDGVRVVPGGTVIRRGAYLAPGVIVMPPSYVNIGAYVGPGSMVDSHVLVGSCAQVGARVHVAAGTQIGGVLEPVGSLPVILEDDAFIGGNCGIYEGIRIRAGAVLAAGVIMTASKPLFDLVNNQRIQPMNGVLEVPANAVVVSGAKGVTTPFGREHNLATSVNMIVKYRDPGTDAKLVLEDALKN
jgi:2,3,4,5-tetrahydropyridine-2,6-dicarboxylate N-succinyltransferase